MLQETHLSVNDLVWPLFIQEGKNQKTPIVSLPGCYRLSLDLIIEEARKAMDVGIKSLALFPVLPDSKKDKFATESYNENGLFIRSIAELKAQLPELVLMTDVAMDPYSSDGHDGLVENGKILNDPTLEILAKMSLAQAKAGADYIAPSDMMDGRVGYIRDFLDGEGYTDTGIMSYAVKYASSLYGPFREALDSAPKAGDKKTYQMNPANVEEALREVQLDLEEGADMVMVKPAHTYLDVIRLVKEISTVPVTAYHVSGEYAMLKAAVEKGWLVEKDAVLEITTAIKRAGADLIFTYYAKQIAEYLR